MTAVTSHNVEEIGRGLRLIADPDGIFEIRALSVKQRYGRPLQMSGYFRYSDIASATAAAADLDTGSIYMTVNPPSNRLLAKSNGRIKAAEKNGTTPDKHIKCRRWQLIDIDPDRPAGIPSTTEEHEASLVLAKRIRDDLTSVGFPLPILIDSGNGSYLLYRIDLPTEDDLLCERFLHGLSKTYTVKDGMKVDETTFNPARIMRIPGTCNRKGDEVLDMDMEHRPCRILEVPDKIEVVSKEQLESIAIDVDDGKKKQTASKAKHDSGKPAWIKDWVKTHADKLPSHNGWNAWNDGEILVFDVCPFDASHDNKSSYITVAANGAIAAGCKHDSCKGNNWRVLRDKVEGQRNDNVEASDEPEPWPELIPFGRSAEETPFPVEVLPSVFGDYVLSVAESRQVPVDLPAMLAIGMMAMACAKRYKVQIGTTHDEPLNLYILSLLEPGERKSQTFKDFTFPADNVEEMLIERSLPVIARAKAQNAIYEEQLKALRRKAAKATPTELEELVIDCTYVEEQIQPLPPTPSVMIGDVTPEYVSAAIHHNGGRVAQVDAEGGTFFKVIGGRYEKNGNGNFEVYLKGHSGDTIRVGRMGRTGELVHNPALTLLMVGQPGLLNRIGNVEELIGRGLIGRMLINFPMTKVGNRTYADRPIDVGMRNRYGSIMSDMLLEPIPEKETTLRIEGKALEIWRKVHDATEKAMSDGGDLFGIRSWAQKYAGHVARIAALLHLMDGAKHDRIDEKYVAGAWAIGEYLQAHALSAFQIIGRKQDVLTGRVLAWIQRHKLPRFTLADAYRDLRRGEDVQGSDDLLPAMAELERHGYVRLLHLNPLNRPGRRPAPAYEVNPMALGGSNDE